MAKNQTDWPSVLPSVLNVVERGGSQAEVGRDLGISRQAVWDALQRIMPPGFTGRLTRPRPISFSFLWRKAGISADALRKLLAEESIPLERRNGGVLLFNEEWALQVIRYASLLPKTQTCPICNAFFKRAPGTNSRFCSERCYKEWEARKRRIFLKNPVLATSETVHPKNRVLIRRLARCRTVKTGWWLVPHEARKFARITKMQLAWLSLRKILATRPHPKKKWRGQPVQTFSKTQLRIVREVYRPAKRRKEKSR